MGVPAPGAAWQEGLLCLPYCIVHFFWQICIKLLFPPLSSCSMSLGCFCLCPSYYSLCGPLGSGWVWGKWDSSLGEGESQVVAGGRRWPRVELLGSFACLRTPGLLPARGAPASIPLVPASIPLVPAFSDTWDTSHTPGVFPRGTNYPLVPSSHDTEHM